MGKLDRLIERYETFHQDSTNRWIHFGCVPLIALSLVGLLWSVKIPTSLGQELSFPLNAGLIFIGLAAVYYASLSLGCLLGMLFFALAGSLLCMSIEASPFSLFWTSLLVFVLAWVGQFIGHHIEGKRPAFLEDLEFLLVSPAWLLRTLYREPRWAILTALLVAGGVFLAADLLFAMKPHVDFSESLGRSSRYDVQIVRDEWGIPHLIGKRNRDSAYGLAYAHAEDDFDTIQTVLLATRGKLASVDGLPGAPNDYYVQLTRIWDDLKESYPRLAPEIREICQAYADGLNLYASRHPEKLERNLWPAHPQDFVAGFMHKMPLMYGLQNSLGRILKMKDEGASLAHAVNPDDYPVGSNFIAVGPGRSADQATRVCINSHQPWTGPVAWYEAHLLTDEGANTYGGLFPGSPVIFLGHNEHIAWGHTVNSPDLVDVFELELDPENNLRYKIDGEWLELERRLAGLEIKLWRNFRWTVNRETLYSIYGPALRVGERVFAVRYAGMGEFRQVEQWYRMGQAKDLEQFKEAMRSQALAMFNTGYADREGNLFYVYNALLPERKEGYDWSDIVPGNTRDTLWTQYRLFDDLPQVENSRSAFIQNCNSSPFQTTSGVGNPSEGDFSETYGIEKSMSNRALRALELYGNDASITRDEFFHYKYDKTYSPESKLRRLVDDFVGRSWKPEDQLDEELDVLRRWNGGTSKDNRSAALALLTFRPRSNTGHLKDNVERAIERLREASANLRKHFGRIDIEWGRINRLTHGDVNLPLGGGPDTLRAIYGRPQEDWTLKGGAGDCFFQFVEWDANGNLQAWATHQFGSSPGHPGSPHYTDQASLFAEEKRRKVLFTREEVLAGAKRTYRPNP